MKNDMRITFAWFGTLMLSPIIIITFLLISTEATRFEIKDFFTAYFLFIIIGILFAIPTLLLLLVFNYYFQKHNWWNKTTMSSFGTVFIFLSFLMTTQNFYSDLKSFVFPGIYSIFFIILIFYVHKINLYELRNKIKKWF
mgnify:FL=1